MTWPNSRREGEEVSPHDEGDPGQDGVGGIHEARPGRRHRRGRRRPRRRQWSSGRGPGSRPRPAPDHGALAPSQESEDDDDGRHGRRAEGERHPRGEAAGVGDDVDEAEDSTHGAGGRSPAAPKTHDVTSVRPPASAVGRSSAPRGGARRAGTTRRDRRRRARSGRPRAKGAHCSTRPGRPPRRPRVPGRGVAVRPGPAHRKSTPPQNAKTTAGAATAITTLHPAPEHRGVPPGGERGDDPDLHQHPEGEVKALEAGHRAPPSTCRQKLDSTGLTAAGSSVLRVVPRCGDQQSLRVQSPGDPRPFRSGGGEVRVPLAHDDQGWALHVGQPRLRRLMAAAGGGREGPGMPRAAHTGGDLARCSLKSSGRRPG